MIHVIEVKGKRAVSLEEDITARMGTTTTSNFANRPKSSSQYQKVKVRPESGVHNLGVEHFGFFSFRM
jgi:hypothetical protein